MSRALTLAKLTDRTAVLTLGVAAGFAIGLSFNAAGREQVAGWFFPASVAPPPAAAPRPVAATAGTPELERPVDPRVVRRIARDNRLRVGVFGDSFGDGLWDALYRTLPRDKGYDVFRFSKEATGFTRYRQIDLEERAKKQVGTQPIDVAIISYGLNDIQPIFAEGHLWPLLSDGWKRIIGERVARFVATVRQTGATAYWVGLPAMADPALDAQGQAMNAFYASEARRLGVPYIDTRAASVDASGRYAAHLPDPRTGRMELIRTPDGVHMIGVGYQRVTAGLQARIRRYAALARRAAGVSEPAASTAAIPTGRLPRGAGQ